MFDSASPAERSAQSKDQSRVLWILLSINAVMFVAEIIAGIVAESTGLMADSLDMLADATVYAIGLYAVGKAVSVKARAALMSGIFQILLALGVAAEVARRLLFGSEPEALIMIGVSMIALLANIVCLVLISKHRDGEVHMRASWIFSKNDVIANVGVIFAGILVYVLASPLPDLVIGALISLIVLRGGVSIVTDARLEKAG
ncbi:MAG: cation transporter [Gammaproteobacteria bacterium]|nr:cation transporter [Gammaproteobacteria bacterium]MBT8110410.1 cation transporter [Gammaproteobacteria bacterium]NND46582.1 cation transporter [Woeseiaceae bacterium]NNL45110.1 cation transporter [Woeseiaceae bacterium]